MRISDWGSDVCSSDLRIARMNSKPSPTPSIRDRARHWAGKHLPKPSTGCFQKCILAVLRRPVESAKYVRSEEHTSELQSLMRISYAVFCLKKKNTNIQTNKPELIVV